MSFEEWNERHGFHATPEQMNASRIEVEVEFDPAEKCGCGCGFPAIRVRLDVRLPTQIGVLGWAMMFAMATRAIANRAAAAEAALPNDEARRLFRKFYHHELNRPGEE